MGTPGNELADAAAKCGEDDIFMEEQNTPLPKIFSRDLIREAIRAQWKEYWKKDDRFKHAKISTLNPTR